MKEQIDKGIFPGAVTLIARHGQVVHYEAHGFLDAAKTKLLLDPTRTLGRSDWADCLPFLTCRSDAEC